MLDRILDGLDGRGHQGAASCPRPRMRAGPTSGSGRGPSTSTPRRKPTPRRSGWRTTPPRWRPSSPARASDWEAELRQRGVEIALMNELGLPQPPPPGAGGFGAEARLADVEARLDELRG